METSERRVRRGIGKRKGLRQFGAHLIVETPESIPEQGRMANDVFMGDKRHRVEAPTRLVVSRCLSSSRRRHCGSGDYSDPPENPERRDKDSGELEREKGGSD